MSRQNATTRPKMTAGDQKWYRMETKEGSAADVYIYDAIDSWYGVDASLFVRELAELDVDTINLFVNSPGGSVFDGVAIMNALRRHPAQVIATVDGLAASAASFIIQAADEVIMGLGSELMIHDASSICWGNAADMAETSALLGQLSANIAEIYAERAGGTAAEWREAMLAETWYTADEAVKAGLADRVEKRKATGNGNDDSSTNSFDLTVFAHAGRRNAPAPRVAAKHERRPNLRLVNGSALPNLNHLVEKATTKPPAEPADNNNPREKGTDNMSEALNKGLRERLGIPADANIDDEGLLAAVDEVLDEQTAPTNARSTEGTVVLDEAQYQELTAMAADGREARKQQLADQREKLVNDAVADGRIAPARRDHWLNALEADPGMAETLNKLAKGLVNLEPSGYTGGVDEATDEDSSLYSKLWPSESTPKES